MPISLSAKKSLRKSLKNRGENHAFKSKFKKLVKEYLGNPSTDGLKKIFSGLDKGKKGNIFHANKVARLKSTYASKLGKTEEKVVSGKKTAKRTKKMS